MYIICSVIIGNSFLNKHVFLISYVHTVRSYNRKLGKAAVQGRMSGQSRDLITGLTGDQHILVITVYSRDLLSTFSHSGDIFYT